MQRRCANSAEGVEHVQLVHLVQRRATLRPAEHVEERLGGGGHPAHRVVEQRRVGADEAAGGGG
jgi:hypothetical protein